MNILLTTIFSILSIANLNAQYFPIPESDVDLTAFVDNEIHVQVKAFSISNLITVAEFKAYLLSVEKDSSKTFYENQLPKLSKKPLELLTEILNDQKLQNEPMPGVSWTVARNYCRWLTAKSASEGWNYSFELPRFSEISAFETIYGIKNPLLETWLLNSYDESLFQYHEILGPESFYETLPNDPPAMKRKMIYGGSYHMDYKKSTYQDSYRRYQYEYQDSSSAFIGFRVVRRSNNRLAKSISKSIDGLSVQVPLVNNHLSGIYCEKFTNGKVKTLGEFQDGQRVGVWSVWDSTGRLQIQRAYKGTRNVEFLFPVIDNPFAALYKKYMPNDLVRNADGIYSYQYVEERAVVYSNRLWRVLNPVNEPELFRQVDFKKLMLSVLTGDGKLFEYGTSGMFQVQVLKEKYPELQQELDSWDFSRIEIKEDFFFSSDILNGQVRQLGMNFYANSTDSLPKYSIYFPQFRKTFATYPVQLKLNPEVKNLDDYFFFKAYRGTIVRTSNVFDREQKKDSELDWELDLETLVAEHRLWLQYGR